MDKYKRQIIIIGITVLLMAVILAGIFVFLGLSTAPGPEAALTLTAPTDTAAIPAGIEPSPNVRTAYIPDPDELQEIPSVSDLKLMEGYITASRQEGILKVIWPSVPDTDYYVLYILDASDAVLQKDILKAEINEWTFPEFQGASVMLLCYKDMGEDGARDDILVESYIENVAPAATQTSATTSSPTPTSAATPSPTPKPSIAPSPTPKSASPEPKNKYIIIVDKEDHAFAAFTYDEKGKYTIKVVTFPCALGRSSRMTPTGTFKISNKGRWKAWLGKDFSPYYTRYTSGLYFHGPIYAEKDGSTMLPESYEEIGTDASAGCIRTTTAGAYWVYAYCPAGTVVKIVKSSDLVSWPGKPPIDPNFPTWDPTDPDKPE